MQYFGTHSVKPYILLPMLYTEYVCSILVHTVQYVDVSIRVTMGKNDKNTFFPITSKVDFGSTSFFLENWSVFHAEFEYDTHHACSRK